MQLKKAYSILDIPKLGLEGGRSIFQRGWTLILDERITRLAHDEHKRFCRPDHVLEVVRQSHDGPLVRDFSEVHVL